MYPILMGNINVNGPDFVDKDDFLGRHSEFDDNLLEFCKISNELESLNFAMEGMSHPCQPLRKYPFRHV